MTRMLQNAHWVDNTKIYKRILIQLNIEKKSLDFLLTLSNIRKKIFLTLNEKKIGENVSSIISPNNNDTMQNLICNLLQKFQKK